MGSSISSERSSKNRQPVPLSRQSTTARYARDSTQSWVQSLPDCFVNSKEGIMASLISFVSELFKQVTSELRGSGLPERADDLGSHQQAFALWKDGKDDIDLKLYKSHKEREAIVFHLANIVLVLGQGPSPSQSETQRFLVQDIRQCLEQASELISYDLGQVPYIRKKPLIACFSDSSSNIKNSIASLCKLSQDIDYTANDIDDNKPRGVAANGQKTELSIYEVVQKQYPYAPANILTRSLEANQDRLRAFYARPRVTEGMSGPISRANAFEGCQTQSEHSTVQSPCSLRFISISDASTTSGSVLIEDELPLTSSATSPSVQETNHSFAQKIRTDQDLTNSTLHCPHCERSFGTQPDLEDHILDHVQPYHCSFINCKFGRPLFDCPLECINHEFEHHRIQYRWSCRYCPASFGQQERLKDHLCQKHGLDCTSAAWKGLLDESCTKLPQPIMEVECDYCHTKSFPTREDYATHVGKHMEQISSLIVLSIIPHKVEISGEFTEPIEIWHSPSHKHLKHYAKLDIGAQDNFISRIIVQQHGIPTRKLVSNKPCIKTVNDVEVEVKEWAEFKWRTGRKNYRDIPFFIVDSIPLREQMILGQDFSNGHAPAFRTVFVLHNEGRGRNSKEQRCLELQSQDDRANREMRQAAIKAERDQTRKPARQDTTPKDPLSSGTEAAK